MANDNPVLWSEIGKYCEDRKDNCHQLIAAQFETAVNKALDAKLSEKGIVVMSRLNYIVTIMLAIGTGLGGNQAVRFLADVASKVKVVP